MTVHIGVDPNGGHGPGHRKPEMPPLSDVADMIRLGEDVGEIAVLFERDPRTLRDRLRGGGWDPDTGEELGQQAADDEPLDWTETIAPLGDAEWMERSLCNQTDPEAFFPDQGGPTNRAKKICMACEVRTECLESALERGEAFGVWGGLSAEERRQLTAQQAAAAERVSVSQAGGAVA